jgi:hypothetical protein
MVTGMRWRGANSTRMKPRTRGHWAGSSMDGVNCGYSISNSTLCGPLPNLVGVDEEEKIEGVCVCVCVCEFNIMDGRYGWQVCKPHSSSRKNRDFVASRPTKCQSIDMLFPLSAQAYIHTKQTNK